MEPRKNRKYTTEFQIEALNLAKELGSFSAASKQLGISDGVIHSWKDKYQFTLNTKSKTAADAVNETEELKRLRKENEELKKVNYILKKAAAFFSQDHLK
jgi:transposase